MSHNIKGNVAKDRDPIVTTGPDPTVTTDSDSVLLQILIRSSLCIIGAVWVAYLAQIPPILANLNPSTLAQMPFVSI